MRRDEEGPPEPTLPALHMHLPIPARAHDLRKRAGVVAIGFVRHRFHRRVGLPGLDADRRQSFGANTVTKPGCQRAGFEPDALQRQINFPQGLIKRLGSLAARPSFTIRPLSSTTQIGKILHGCSS